jgi:D-alanyl-D-alanine carboxypeptidase
MRSRPTVLLNTPDIELWPAHLLRARANADARLLARARHVLRRKRDGRFLAASTPDGIEPLMHGWRREPGVDLALRRLREADAARVGPRDLPLARIAQRLHALGLDADAYAARTGLALVAEPAALTFAGLDRYRRPLGLRPAAARDWQRMQHAAQRDGLVLEAISGYRSHDYQLGIFERKLARGQSVETILTVNAAPGYSEHHSGRALDIASPGEPPAEESFEATPAFAWLRENAVAFGFAMSYPRDNPHGIVYEPWHWCHGG